MKRTKTSVSLENKLLGELRVEARSHRRSLSQIIEMFLVDALSVHRSLKLGRRSINIRQVN
jgi:hypothetical protein